MGKAQDIETAGGGRIVVFADSVEFTGAGDKLQANARPYQGRDAKYALAGGSGGYIYVATSNQYNENRIDPVATISAVGGFGTQGAFSGSGGVIVLDDNFAIPVEQVSANGGTADVETEGGCGNGAAGTIWYRPEDALYVDNKDTETDKMTVVTIPPASQVPEQPEVLAKKLVVQGRSNLGVQGEHRSVAFDELEMHSHSKVSLGETKDKLKVLFRESAQISATSTLDFSAIQWVALTTDFDGEGQNDVITVGTVVYQHFLAIKAPHVNVVGPISMVNTTD